MSNLNNLNATHCTWLTTNQAAEVIGCHRKHVQHLIKQGKLTARKFGRAWQIHYAKVYEYSKTKQTRGFPRGQKRS